MNVPRIILFAALLINHLYADQYFYPVAGVTKNNERYIYLLYQKNIDQLELFLWHEPTKIITKVLPARYMPTSVCMMPDQRGFSFIDNGRIRLKLFNKRTPKSIDFNESLYQIELIHWLDESNFYFSAKEDGVSSVYQGTNDGSLFKLCSHESIDCLYPQKIDQTLYYISKNNNEFAINCIDYPALQSSPQITFNESQDFDIRVEQLLKLKQEGYNYTKNPSMSNFTCLHNSAHQPIAFLRMFNKRQGYFIKHAAAIDSQDEYVVFTYSTLEKVDRAWITNDLFSFSIPLALLSGESGHGYHYRSENKSRLHESMLPLLPCHHHDKIYYMDISSTSQCLALYSYNCLTHKIKQISFRPNHICGMIKLDDVLFYGCSIPDAPGDNADRHVYKAEQNNNTLPKGIWFDKDGHMCYDQPYVKLK